MPHPIDRSLLYVTLTLFVAGLLILASASMVLSYKNLGSVVGYVLRQIAYGGVAGIIAMYAASRVPYRIWRTLAVPLMLFSLVLMALIFIPQLGLSIGGARRWLNLGPLSFQPSEILKITFIIYLASWLDARRRDVETLSQGMIPFAMMISVVGVFLVMQPDLGTLFVVVVTAGLLYFLGGGKVSQVITLAMLGIAAFYLLAQLAPYRSDRLRVFFNPGLDPQGKGYQITQASIAVGSGGFAGLGFGKSVQKYQYVPEPMTDSIFAIFAEETGFLGASALAALFFSLFWRGLSIAKRSPDVLGKLLASGISIGIMTQAFVNMAAISGLLPLTGIPLPFVSYGGSSLAMTLASVGILMNISRYT